MQDETIVAVSSARGAGGVAVVRLSGPDAHALAAALTGRNVVPSQAGRFFYTPLRHNGELLDKCVMKVFAAPHSYTGQDVVEFDVHGGEVVPQRVVAALTDLGARLARRGEFTERAFLNGKLSLEAAQGVMDLISATTARAATAASARLFGHHASNAIERAYDRTLALAARVEHALDIDDSDLPPRWLADVATELTALRRDLDSFVQTAQAGRVLRSGALVVLAGHQTPANPHS